MASERSAVSGIPDGPRTVGAGAIAGVAGRGRKSIGEDVQLESSQGGWAGLPSLSSPRQRPRGKR
jgi:hypothetical protein